MEGWNKNTVVVIGRNQANRIDPFASKLRNESPNLTVMTFNANPAWSREEALAQNELFIKVCQDKDLHFMI
jgi:hypothetical protein